MALTTGMALLGSAAVGAAGTYYASSQASKAAKAQAAGATEAGRISAEQYAQTREDLEPWRKVGENALYQFADTLGIPPPGATEAAAPDYSGFESSPGYLFRQREGQKAVERSKAARGLLKSGGTVKALQERGQDIASGEYGNYMNRLATAAGIGQTATTSTASFGAGAAGAAGRATEEAARARASGYLGAGQAVQQGISGIQSLGGYWAGMERDKALLEALK